MATDKATPKNWKTIGKFVCDSENVAIAQCGSQMPMAEEEKRANAKLIVRAVNRDHLFEELVEALAFLLTEFKDGDISAEDYYNAKNKCEEIYKKAKAAV